MWKGTNWAAVWHLLSVQLKLFSSKGSGLQFNAMRRARVRFSYKADHGLAWISIQKLYFRG